MNPVSPTELIGIQEDIAIRQASPSPLPLNLRELVEQYNRDGYLIVRGLLSSEEVEEIRAIFSRIHEQAVIPGFYDRTKPCDGVTNPEDPLFQYPRVMMPHRFNPRARHYLLHPKVCAVVEALVGGEPVATQSMFFYKPPGARGQAMHQDEFYLLVEPGTCMAAWTAIDDADAENGGMMIVPQTQDLELFCNPEKADSKESFAKQRVPIPKGARPVLAEMKAGDTLFFNGSAIHGSGPNRSKERFRRSFIAHYARGDLRKISHWYLPLVRMDGTDFEVEKQNKGGPCGDGWDGATH